MKYASIYVGNEEVIITMCAVLACNGPAKENLWDQIWFQAVS